ncbi:hypothetical protein [Neorhizobium tomejilense]|uniref:hypothetical protein n=1 Tax=Neorhizobium tomejilense TaxID=2093828 RepID=UPI000CF9E9CB|nr:hypothetical protein [Neorhizobium tomejilense]
MVGKADVLMGADSPEAMIRLHMGEADGLRLLEDLIVVNGRQLKDPLLSKGLFFDQFKKDALESVLRVATSYEDHLVESWHSLTVTLAEINGQMAIFGLSGIKVPTYEHFIEMLREVTPEKSGNDLRPALSHVAADCSMLGASKDNQRNMLERGRRVMARCNELREHGLSPAPLEALPGSPEEVILKHWAEIAVDNSAVERVALLSLIVDLQMKMSWRFDAAAEAAWKNNLETEIAEVRRQHQ